MDIDVKNPHPLEVKLLRHVKLSEEITADRIISELGYKVGQCNQAFSWLEAKGCLVESGRNKKILYELTELGKEQKAKGLPVERIFTFLKENGPHSMPEISEALSLEKSDVGSAFGLLSKEGITRLNEERKAEVVKDELPAEIKIQRALLDKVTDVLDDSTLSEEERKAIQALSKKRGAANSTFKLIEREEVTHHLTELGEEVKEAVLKANITGEEFGLLTPEMLSSGSWKNGSF